MSDKKVDASATTSRPVAERIAFDHLVFIRLHMEALVSAVDESTKMPFSPRSIINLRHAFLDIRMVIEELMLLSVSAHKDAGEFVTKSLRSEYQADKKMSRLRALNAHFFPDAIDVVPSDDTSVAGRFIQLSDEYLTEQEAKSYYNRCGENLHASWKLTSLDPYREDLEYANRFIHLASRLLKTFEIDISGQGYMMLGHLNLGEPKPPSLFFARGMTAPSA